MPAQNSAQVRVGATGKLYVAPLGTAAPADANVAWPSGWVEVGLTTDDGVNVNPSLARKDLNAWQSLYPVRTIITSRGIEMAFKLIQKAGTNLQLVFGGGSITNLGGAPVSYKYVPPAASFIDERAFGLEVNDGSITDRFLFYRGLITDIGNIIFRHDDDVKFELKATMLLPASGDFFNIISNDPAMAS